MAGRYQTYKFTYNTTTIEMVFKTDRVSRTPEEISTELQTPTGERYKQVYGEKYTWNFTFSLTERAILEFFNTAYEQAKTADIILSEEQDNGTFETYTVIVDRPNYSPDTIAADAIDRGLTVRVAEA